jgi:hypothetical protein
MLKIGAATGGGTLLASTNPFSTRFLGTTAHGEVGTEEKSIGINSNAIPGSSLGTLLPGTLPSFELRLTNEVYHRALNATEVIGHYGNEAGNSVSTVVSAS